MMATDDGKSRVRDDPCQWAAGWRPTGTDLSQLSHELGRTTPDSGVNAGQPVDHDLRIRTPAHWPDTFHRSTDQMACLAQLDSDMTRLVDAQSEDPRDSG